MIETWKPVPGYEGTYEVSDHGRVKSLDREVTDSFGYVRRYSGRILKGGIDKKRAIEAFFSTPMGEDGHTGHIAWSRWLSSGRDLRGCRSVTTMGTHQTIAIAICDMTLQSQTAMIKSHMARFLLARETVAQSLMKLRSA